MRRMSRGVYPLPRYGWFGHTVIFVAIMSVPPNVPALSDWTSCDSRHSSEAVNLTPSVLYSIALVWMAMFSFALRPYQLDIPVTWAFMPSRDEYLAAKMRAWSRDADAMTACARPQSACAL